MGKPCRDSEDIRDRLKAALQTLTRCSWELRGEGAVSSGGCIKLSTRQRGGDTGSDPRELWVKDEQEVVRGCESKPYGSTG